MNPNANNSADALGLLKQAQTTVQNPQAYVEQQNQALGVEAARANVQGLRGAIAGTTKLLQGVAPSVAGRASNSLVTAAGQNRMIQNESAPISATLGQQNQDYQSANADFGSLEDKAFRNASLQYQGQQDNISYLQNLYNTLYQREEAEKAQQEQIRQFNAQLAESRRASSASSGSGYDVSSIVNALGGGSSGEKKYIGNDDFRGALAYAAKNGNNDAKLALNKVGNDRLAAGPVSQAEYDALKRLGIGGGYYVSKPAAKTNYAPNAGINNGYYSGALGLGR